MSNSLGTLTLDLIAKTGSFTGPLDKASRNAKKNSNDISKALSGIGKATGAMGIAITAGLSALILNAAAAEDQINDLSAAAGMSSKDFKGFAYALGTVGVSAEQVSEQSRRIQTNLAKFLQTGKGGFADVFDVLRGKTDLTAESLRGLAGPEALQKVKNAMDEANVPIEQQGYLLDRIYKGAGKLLPLLNDQGAALREMTDKFHEYNDQLLLSSEQSNTLASIADDWDLLKQTMGNATTYLASYFAPEFKYALEMVIKNVPIATKLLTTFFDSFSSSGSMKDLDAIQVKLVGLQDQVSNYQDEMKKAKALGYDTSLEQGIVAKKLDEIETLQKQKELLTKQRDAEAAAPALSIPERDVVDTAAMKKAAEEKIKLGQELLDAKNRQVQDEIDLMDSLDSAQQDRINTEKEYYDDQLADAEYFLDRIKQDNMDELQWINDMEEEKRSIAQFYRDQGIWDEERYQEAITEITKKATKEREDYELQSMAMRASVGESFFGAFTDIAEQAFGKQNDMYKALFLAQKAFAAMTIIVNAHIAASNAAAQLPFLAGMTMAEATLIAGYANAGMVAGMALAGMAHDGMDSVPETGTWLLKKGERVTTAETSAKLDKKLDGMKNGGAGNITIINQTTGRIDKTEKRETDSGTILLIREVLETEARNPNSKFNKAMTQTRHAPRRL